MSMKAPKPKKKRIGGRGTVASSGAFDEILAGGIDRANVRFLLPEDSRYYVTEWTRTQINEKVEWLWQHFALVKELVAGIARHTIGKGISLQLDTEDPDFNTAGERDFENWALTPDRCDIAARRNFYECQTTAVEQWSLRGEFFSAWVANERWPAPRAGNPAAPSFWLIDSDDVQTPGAAIAEKLAGEFIDGIRLGDYGEPKEFSVRLAGSGEYSQVPVSEMCHWFKPHAVNQPRGFSPFAQAVNPLVDVHELVRGTVRGAKAQNLVSMVLKGIGKKPGRGVVGVVKANTSRGGESDGGAEIEAAGRAAGAAIAYVDAEGDVKMVSSTSPSPLVSPFVRDLLLRNATLAPGVPMEFFYDPSSLGGPDMRFILGRADLFFQVLADALVYRFCTPTAIRVLAWRMQNGLLPVCKDPQWMDKVSWQLPARLTVDMGREGALDIQKLRACMLTLRSYYNARGTSWRSEIRQRIREMQELKRLCDEAGMPELFSYFVALDPGATLVNAAAIDTAVNADTQQPGKQPPKDTGNAS